jgi:integrase
MNSVGAITDKQKIFIMKEWLQSRSARDYCLFLLGINTGIRINDLLHLQVKDVADESGNIHPYMQTSEACFPPIYFNLQVRQALRSCILENGLQWEDPLFKSRKSQKSITRVQAYRIINEAAQAAGIDESVGTHTLRKTFGYHAYLKGIAVSLIQKRLQQSSPSETYSYLGISPKNPPSVTLDVNL